MQDDDRDPDDQTSDTSGDPALDAMMREAVEAVEAVERKKKGDSGAVRPLSPSEAEELASQGFDDDEEKLSELDLLRQEISSLKESSIRTLADFDNYRKRVERERTEQRRYAALDPLREILPIMDNLERALAAGGSLEDLKTGVELIHRQMEDLLKRFQVEAVPAEGERFDPNIHEAMMREEDDVPEPMVTQELQRGYKLHERLIRPAMVKVAMPSSPQPRTEAADASEDDGGDQA